MLALSRRSSRPQDHQQNSHKNQSSLSLSLPPCCGFTKPKAHFLLPALLVGVQDCNQTDRQMHTHHGTLKFNWTTVDAGILDLSSPFSTYFNSVLRMFGMDLLPALCEVVFCPTPRHFAEPRHKLLLSGPEVCPSTSFPLHFACTQLLEAAPQQACAKSPHQPLACPLQRCLLSYSNGANVVLGMCIVLQLNLNNAQQTMHSTEQMN